MTMPLSETSLQMIQQALHAVSLAVVSCSCNQACDIAEIKLHVEASTLLML